MNSTFDNRILALPQRDSVRSIVQMALSRRDGYAVSGRPPYDDDGDEDDNGGGGDDDDDVSKSSSDDGFETSVIR